VFVSNWIVLIGAVFSAVSGLELSMSKEHHKCKNFLFFFFMNNHKCKILDFVSVFI
jgi:hypothetical protein